MKRRFADKPDWSRVLEKDFKLIHVENEDLKGYLSNIYIKEITEPLVIQTLGVDYCIVDKNYTWLQYLPDGENYVLTVMIDDKGEVIQWYFDISEEYELNDEGMPYYDDLYLDLAVLTTGEVILLDEDEIEEALKAREITSKQYEAAWSQTRQLKSWLEEEFEELKKLTKKYFSYMKDL